MAHGAAMMGAPQQEAAHRYRKHAGSPSPQALQKPYRQHFTFRSGLALHRVLQIPIHRNTVGLKPMDDDSRQQTADSATDGDACPKCLDATGEAHDCAWPNRDLDTAGRARRATPKPSTPKRGRAPGGHGFGFAVFCGDEGYMPDSSLGPYRSLREAAQVAAGEAGAYLDGFELKEAHKTGDALRDGQVAVFLVDGHRVARWTVEPLLDPWGGREAHLVGCDGFCQEYGDGLTCAGCRTDG